LQNYFQKFFGIFLSLRCISGRQISLLIKKLSFFDKKVAKKFGGLKKATYLCTENNYRLTIKIYQL